MSDRSEWVTAKPATRPLGLMAGGGPDLDAAHARIAELEARLRETRAERDEAKDGFLSERRHVIELRQVLTEVFTCLDAKDIDLFDDDQVDEWRKRAGIEAGQ